VDVDEAAIDLRLIQEDFAQRCRILGTDLHQLGEGFLGQPDLFGTTLSLIEYRRRVDELITVLDSYLTAGSAKVALALHEALA